MLAIYQYYGFDLPIKERFRLIKSAGFDAVGLRRDDWESWPNYRDFADMARASGLMVFDGHAPFRRDYDIVNSIWLDNLEGEKTYETYTRVIKECGEDGVVNLIVHLQETGAPPPNELGIRRLRSLLDTAVKAGVKLAIENIYSYTYLGYIFQRIQSPNLGFCFDAGHRNAFEPSADLPLIFGDRLIAIHLHDNNGSGDQHLIPFEGKINWQKVMSHIAATGYTGPTTLECTTGRPGLADYGPRSAEEWLHDAYIAAKRLDDMRQIK